MLASLPSYPQRGAYGEEKPKSSYNVSKDHEPSSHIHSSDYAAKSKQNFSTFTSIREPVISPRVFGKLPSFQTSPRQNTERNVRNSTTSYQSKHRDNRTSQLNSSEHKHSNKSSMSLVGPSPRYLWKPQEKPLGSGYTSTVHQGLDVMTGRSIAVKVVPKVKQRLLASDQYYRELYSRIPTIPHPNLVKLHDFFEDTQNFYIVSDLCTGPDLVDFVLEFEPGTIPLQTSRQLIFQILSGLNRLHNAKILHRDIKLDNILFLDEQKERINIIDFDMGLLQDVKTPPKRLSNPEEVSVVGTKDYMAAECYRGQYRRTSDLWSIGVILFIFLDGHFPFNFASAGRGHHEAREVLKRGLRIAPQLRRRCPLAVDLLERLLKVDPLDRMQSAWEALSHPWLTLVPRQVPTPKDAESNKVYSRFHPEASQVVKPLTKSASDEKRTLKIDVRKGLRELPYKERQQLNDGSSKAKTDKYKVLNNIECAPPQQTTVLSNLSHLPTDEASTAPSGTSDGSTIEIIQQSGRCHNRTSSTVVHREICCVVELTEKDHTSDDDPLDSISSYQFTTASTTGSASHGEYARGCSIDLDETQNEGRNGTFRNSEDYLSVQPGDHSPQASNDVLGSFSITPAEQIQLLPNQSEHLCRQSSLKESCQKTVHPQIIYSDKVEIPIKQANEIPDRTPRTFSSHNLKTNSMTPASERPNRTTCGILQLPVFHVVDQTTKNRQSSIPTINEQRADCCISVRDDKYHSDHITGSPDGFCLSNSIGNLMDKFTDRPAVTTRVKYNSTPESRPSTHLSSTHPSSDSRFKQPSSFNAPVNRSARPSVECQTSPTKSCSKGAKVIVSNASSTLHRGYSMARLFTSSKMT